MRNSLLLYRPQNFLARLWYSNSKKAEGLKGVEYDYEYRAAEYEKIKRYPAGLTNEPCAADIKELLYAMLLTAGFPCIRNQ